MSNSVSLTRLAAIIDIHIQDDTPSPRRKEFFFLVAASDKEE